MELAVVVTTPAPAIPPAVVKNPLPQQKPGFSNLEEPNKQKMGRNSPAFSKRTACFSAIFIIMFLGILGLAGALINQMTQGNSSETPGPKSLSTSNSLNTDQVKNLQSVAQQIDSIRDSSLDPCQDFYQYSCQSWLKNRTIPSETNRYGIFDIIGERNNEVVKAILEENWPLIGPFYSSCMDLQGIDDFPTGNPSSTASPQKIPDELQRIFQTIQTMESNRPLYTLSDYFSLLGEISLSDSIGLIGNSPLWKYEISPNSLNPIENVFLITQNGLSMKSQANYKNPEQLNEFQGHVEKMFTLLGDSPALARENARKVQEFESSLISFSLPPADLRSPQKVYNPYKISSLSQYTEGIIPWNHYFYGLGILKNSSSSSSSMASSIGENFTIVIDNPNFVKNIAWLLRNMTESSSSSPTTWGGALQYLRWNLLHAYAEELSQPFRDENHRFFGLYLAGQQSPATRWKYCVNRVTSLLGDVVGRYYVSRAFGGDSLPKIRQIITAIRSAMKENLETLASKWMDSSALSMGLMKLSDMAELIGTSEKWSDYNEISISRAGKDYLANTRKLRKFLRQEDFQQIYRPVDKKRWLMTQPTVNAYYIPKYNSINFPSGILQPPFFSQQFPMGLNFGGIGMVAAHEITHGFDDSGSQFDNTGLMRSWWNPETAAEFVRKSQCFVEQYNQEWYNSTTDSVHLNGRLTLGENIADNGGVHLALLAYRKFLQQSSDPLPPTSPPLKNSDQLFFIGLAQTWCRAYQQKAILQLVQTDVHSLSRSRVNVPLKNRPEFAEAFQCPVGSPMNPGPEKRCEIW